jgi:hypothetical protein
MMPLVLRLVSVDLRSDDGRGTLDMLDHLKKDVHSTDATICLSPI